MRKVWYDFPHPSDVEKQKGVKIFSLWRWKGQPARTFTHTRAFDANTRELERQQHRGGGCERIQHTLSTLNAMTETRFDVGMTWYDLFLARGAARRDVACILFSFSHARHLGIACFPLCTVQRRMCICSKEDSRKDGWSQ